jgi:hypothetical protein
MASPTVTVRQKRKRYKVTTTTGHEIELQSLAEQKFYVAARNKYLSDNKFTVASDMRALDRLLLMEVQMYRWQWQLAAGVDYDLEHLEASDEAALQKAIKETGIQVSQVQNDLGLTKAQRDKDDEDSVGAYLIKLRQRAKEFGVHREKQLGRALELMNECFGLAGAYKRSNAKERGKLGFESAEDIVDWLLEVAQPRFEEIDQHFRENNQKFWTRDA